MAGTIDSINSISRSITEEVKMHSFKVKFLSVSLGLFFFFPIISTLAKENKSMNNSKLKIIETKNAPEAIGAYSQGIEINGTYYFSGQIGIDPASMKLQPTFETQLDQILKNIDALLEETGLTRSNIVKSTIFLTDLSNFGVVNAAYTAYFQEGFPARSCIEASKLPKDALVEIEVIAHK